MGDLSVRTPPQDPEAEQAVLGAMLLSPQALFTASQSLRLEDFYRESHRGLFQALVTLFDQDVPVDLMTLANELRRLGDWEAVGGSMGLTLLMERVPTASNVDHYIRIVQRLSEQRRCIAFLSRRTEELYGFDCEAERVRDELFDFCVTSYGRDQDDFAADPADLARRTAARLRLAKSGEQPPFIPSGFAAFDEKFGGWQRGALTTIEAAPKAGKSFLMMNSMNASAQRHGTRTGYLILDMSRETLMLRLLSLRLHRTIVEIQGAGLPMEPIERELSLIQELPLRIAGEENIGNDMNRILRWMTYARKHFGIELFFVDSFTKIEVKPARGQTDESYISHMVNAFQRAAKALDAAVVGTVDLNYEGHAKGSSRWGYGPDAVFKVALSEDKLSMTVESKFLRNHAAGSQRFSTHFRWSEVRPFEAIRGGRP